MPYIVDKSERCSQRMDINLEDMNTVLQALLKVGYECVVSQDGEEMDVVMINYVHPEFSGHFFEEVFEASD